MVVYIPWICTNVEWLVSTTVVYHTEYFHGPKNLLCSIYSSLPIP